MNGTEFVEKTRMEIPDKILNYFINGVKLH